MHRSEGAAAESRAGGRGGVRGMDVYVLTFRAEDENSVEAVYLTAEAAMLKAQEDVGEPLLWHQFNEAGDLYVAEIHGMGYRVEKAELVGAELERLRASARPDLDASRSVGSAAGRGES